MDKPIADLDPTLRWVLTYDLRRRLTILAEEISYLESAICYRNARGSAKATNGEAREYIPDGQSSVLSRLLRAVSILKKESEIELEELNHFVSIRRKADSIDAMNATTHQASKSDGPERRKILKRKSVVVDDGRISAPVSELGAGHIHLLWHAKKIRRAAMLAERLGELHDRLDFFIQRTNPDHPEPTIRRRAEQGLHDKFLSQHIRWAHRDLATFASDPRFLGAAYPYRFIPTTLQTWDYSETSRLHRVVGTDHYHDEWLQSRHDWVKTNSKDRPEIVSTATLSYWMPERLALHPIIGHELGHSILRDIYGRALDSTLLEEDDSVLGQTIRSLTGCAEAWISQIPSAKVADESRSLAIECTADALGAARYGMSFLYAWLLEGLATNELQVAAEDRYELLTQLNALEFSTWEDFCESGVRYAIPRMRLLENTIPQMYYRGRLLVQYMSACNRETDLIATQFLEAFDAALDILLDLYTNGSESVKQFHSAFASDLAQSASMNSPNSIWDNRRNSPVFRTRRFHGGRKGKRSNEEYHPLERQRLSDSFCDQIDKWADEFLMMLVPLRPEDSRVPIGARPRLSPDAAEMSFKDLRGIGTLHDLTWRAEWSMHLCMSICDDIVDPKNRRDAKQRLVRRTRWLQITSMDDYIGKISRPTSMLRGFEDRSGAYEDSAVRSLVEGNFDPFDIELKSESLDWERIRDSYDEQIQLASVAAATPNLSPAFSCAIQQVSDGMRWNDLFPQGAEQRHYDLTLFNVRDGQVFSAPDLNPVVSYRDRSNETRDYPPEVYSALLGRYDGLLISDPSTLPGDYRQGIKFRSGVSTEIDMAVRTKRIVPVGRQTAPLGKEDRFFCCLLIALEWENGRLPFVRWLSGELKKINNSLQSKGLCLEFRAWLSDGWDDVIVTATYDASKVDGGLEGRRAFYGEVFPETRELIHTLASRTFVRTTESLFGQALIEALPKECGVRFVCRHGRFSGISEAVVREKLVNECSIDERCFRIRVISGMEDFEVAAMSDEFEDKFKRSAARIHAGLHDIRNSDDLRPIRVSTRLLWPHR